MKRVGVALVGHDPLVQEGIRRILSGSRFDVSAAYGFLEQVGKEEGPSFGDPFIILVNGGSVEVEEATLTELRDRYPAGRVLVLVEKFELSPMMQALRAGVSGYLVSDLSAARLVESLEMVAAGEKVLPPQLLDILGDETLRPDAETSATSLSSANLSDREMQLLRCLVAGMPNKLVARRLDISEATVKVHVKAVLRKLGVRNRTQAAMWGAMRGIGNMLDQADAGSPGEAGGIKESSAASRSGSDQARILSAHRQDEID